MLKPFAILFSALAVALPAHLYSHACADQCAAPVCCVLADGCVDPEIGGADRQQCVDVPVFASRAESQNRIELREASAIPCSPLPRGTADRETCRFEARDSRSCVAVLSTIQRLAALQILLI